MAIATGCVVAAGALITSSTGRSVMMNAASNSAQQILTMVLGISTKKEKNYFLSSRIQAKLECILHLFQAMQHKMNTEDKGDTINYERTMWNRVFREMASISTLVEKMKREQEEDLRSWTRSYWPRSQTQKQMSIIGHLETIEEIIRFVSMVAPYVHAKSV